MLELQYNGTTSANIRVVQKNGDEVFNGTVAGGASFSFTGTDKGTLGTEIKVYVDGNLNTPIHTSCSQAIGPGLVFGDFEVVMGYSKDGGLLCPLEPPPPPPPGDCAECSGKVTMLELQYNGTTSANIRVVQKNGDEVFNGTVAGGASFSFTGTDKGTLGTEIKVYVDGNLNTPIHTSCSQAIGPGLVFGDFEVVMGYSKDGGLLCPLEPPPPGECRDCQGGVTDLTLQYNGNMEDAHVEVTLQDGTNLFDGTVQPGDDFSFSAPDGTTLDDVIVKITAQTEIKGDCTEPIGPGLVRGDF